MDKYGKLKSSLEECSVFFYTFSKICCAILQLVFFIPFRVFRISAEEGFCRLCFIAHTRNCKGRNHFNLKPQEFIDPSQAFIMLMLRNYGLTETQLATLISYLSHVFLEVFVCFKIAFAAPIWNLSSVLKYRHWLSSIKQAQFKKYNMKVPIGVLVPSGVQFARCHYRSASFNHKYTVWIQTEFDDKKSCFTNYMQSWL